MGSSRGVAICGVVRACTLQGREHCASGGVLRQNVAREAHGGFKSLLASRLRPLSSKATHPPNYPSLHRLWAQLDLDLVLKGRGFENRHGCAPGGGRRNSQERQFGVVGQTSLALRSWGECSTGDVQLPRPVRPVMWRSWVLTFQHASPPLAAACCPRARPHAVRVAWWPRPAPSRWRPPAAAFPAWPRSRYCWRVTARSWPEGGVTLGRG